MFALWSAERQLGSVELAWNVVAGSVMVSFSSLQDVFL